MIATLPKMFDKIRLRGSTMFTIRDIQSIYSEQDDAIAIVWWDEII